MSTGNRKGPVLRADKRSVPAAKTKSSRKSTGLVSQSKSKAKPTKAKSASSAKRKTTRARKTARSKQGGTWLGRTLRRMVSWIFRMIFAITWRVTAVGLLIVLGITAYHYAQLPPALALTDGRVRGSVTLLDRNGEVFAWRGDQFGGIITADTVSPHLKNAILATEDRRFYRHFGVSPRGIAGAVRINLREGRGPLQGHGGSTITQQVAKLLCLGTEYDPSSGMTEAEYEAECRGGGITRKLREVPYSFALEAKYSKDEILTIYLNRAYLGAGARGFAAASQRYFGKSAADVNPAEAAMLAGLLVAPSRFAPTSDLERSQARAATIVRLMQDQGFISDTEAAVAIANPATLSEAAEKRAGGYFADWVMDTAPSFLASQTTEDVIIRSTLDQGIQSAAEEALKYVFENKVSPGSQAQAAIVVMSADGAVRAMVGGRKLQVSGAFNRATQALRQTGSAFKPFVYAAALDLGWRYDDLILDAPLTLNIPGSGPWSPRNYTNEFYGNVTLTHALKTSLNTPAVRLSEDVGRDNVRQVATDFGIAQKMAEGPALALGASESTLLEMTAAYAGILNGGSSVAPYGLSELRLLEDPAPLLGQTGGIGERVISQGAAEQLIYMMHEVVESGTGRRAKLPDGRPAAAKTGTTQAARDAWFVGFTADYVAGVWMGYDDNTPLTGVTGGGLPAEIWRETMTRVHDGDPIRELNMQLPGPRLAELRPGQDPGSRNIRTPGNLQEAADQFRRDVGEVERAIGGVLRQLFGN
ncbi:MAG: transglycosylase domain-containing protein [Dinoroseobacter sp.]|nr:transglycosylase domain-containing protein [Dinoroseobacter sp.]